MEYESSPPSHEKILEALLFAHADPLPSQRILDILEDLDAPGLEAVVTSLNESLEASGRPLVVREIAGGYQMLTRPEYHSWLTRLVKTSSDKLTSAALETLAIIAYKQPLTRADIESVRGVQSGQIVRTLLDHKLVRITGRAEVIGRPLLYGTTRRFLDQFGLSSLRDLPSIEELQQLVREEDEARARTAEAEATAEGPPIPVDRILAPGLRSRPTAPPEEEESQGTDRQDATDVPVDRPVPPSFRRELFLAGAEMLRARERQLPGEEELPEDVWEREPELAERGESPAAPLAEAESADRAEPSAEELAGASTEAIAGEAEERAEPSAEEVSEEVELLEEAEPIVEGEEHDRAALEIDSHPAAHEVETDGSTSSDPSPAVELGESEGSSREGHEASEDEPMPEVEEAGDVEEHEFELEDASEELPQLSEDDYDEPYHPQTESQER